MLTTLRRLLGKARQQPPAPVDTYDGDCDVCGRSVTFPCFGDWLRESYKCPVCNASVRYRAQARAILDSCAQTSVASFAGLVEQPDFRALHIYEPGIAGPFRRYLTGCPNYRQSVFREDHPATAPGDGIENQDLQRLSMPSQCVDLVITSDIFEHVRKPIEAFAEIGRILRPAGRHVFFGPVVAPLA